LLYNVTEAHCQTDVSDLATWTTVSVNPALMNGKWDALLTFEYRSKENISQTDLYSFMATADYVINRRLRVGLGYEIYFNRTPSGFTREYRYYPGATYSLPLGRFSAALRTRLINTFTKIAHPYWENRTRLKIKYSPSNIPVKPFISAEPYISISKPRFQVNKIRCQSGFSFSSGIHSIDLYYMQEKYYSKDFVRHIICLDYTVAVSI
jgi:hypothetical protein